MVQRDIFVLVLLLAIGPVLAGCAQKSFDASPPSVITQFDGQHDTASLRTSHDLELFTQHWGPPSKPRGLVLLLHGTTMHSGAYSEVGKFLASEGYLVYGLDLRGWGRSEGRGARGYVASHEQYVWDLDMAIQRLKSNYPEQKLYVMGESLGATVALYGHLKYGLSFDGMIFSGPAFKPNVELMGIRGPRFLHNVSMVLGATLGQSLPGLPTLSSDLGIRMVNDDSAMEKKLLNDPYVSHSFLPAAYLTSLSEALGYIQTNIEDLELPLMIAHGQRDVLIPVHSSEELIERASGDDQTLKVYACNHTTLLGTKRYEVYRDIENWLDQREERTKPPAKPQIIRAEQLSRDEAYTLGELHFQNGHYSAARQYFLTVQEKYPSHLDSLLYLGLAELRMDSVERSEALKRFRTVQALDPDHPIINQIMSTLSTGENPDPCQENLSKESTC